jgi:hypothetical protein
MDDMEFKAHFDHTKDTLNHIRMDVDNLLKKGETTMGEDMGWLAAMLNKQGVDPAVLAMLDRDRDNGALGDNGLVLLFLILLLGGGNGFGFGRNGPMDGVAGVDRTVVNEANYSRLMDAVAGNRDAIAGLAQTLNCDMNSIQSALCGVDKALAVNQGSIINAIQSCCCNIQNKIQECCCQTNLNIERQGCQTRADIQETRFLISNGFAAQTQLMQQMACDNRAYLADQFCQIKTREDQREIQTLRDKLEDAKADSRMVAILAAVNGKDTVSGVLNTTAGTWSGTVS